MQTTDKPSPEAMRAAEEISGHFGRDLNEGEDDAERLHLAHIIDTQCNLAKYKAVVEAAKRMLEHDEAMCSNPVGACQPAEQLRLALSALDSDVPNTPSG